MEGTQTTQCPRTEHLTKNNNPDFDLKTKQKPYLFLAIMLNRATFLAIAITCGKV